ncbi:alcohol dehydrogenase catalytic domain-containing protein [Pseudonocardia sp. CA-107938]|uniref:alcohol dehydrogenase catalytic domain-containing protein n=1 Tax=Pseudonocardia sp. CA-107938 TaxID=3240021 RepID=UPI003D924DF9
MIAYQLHGEQDLRREEVPVPEVGEGEVQVRIAHNGICGSDLHFYYASAQSGWPRPRAIGHEFAGTVTAVGPGVTDTAVGDRVCVFPIDSCGECRQCRADYPVLCEVVDRSVSTIGCGSPIGAMAEYAVVPNRLIIPLPDELTLAQGALVEPIAVATTAVQRAEIGRDTRVAVLGGGPIGIGAVLALEALDVEQFVVVEPSPARRTALQTLTKARIVDPSTEDAAAEVRALTGGHGVDVVIECAGVPASLDSAFAMVGKRGKIVLIGLFEKPYESFSPNPVALMEVSVVGHNGSTKHAFRTVLQWMREGRIPTDSWVRHVPFDEAVDAGFEPLRRGEEIKILVDLPQG